MSWHFQWRPYVPVAKRKADAQTAAAKLAKKEKRELTPVFATSKTIAASFWGKAWCQNLERYSDYANRLPRGRSYLRNGSVVDLQILQGKVKALVAGSEMYKVVIDIKTLPTSIWAKIKHDCANSVDSLIDLLQAKFDKGIMERLTERETGMFPQPKEIKLSCSCPDGAYMCKHVAAVMYGVGARLDAEPELLFTLRDVDQLELISQAVDADNLGDALQGKNDNALAGSDLGEIFGIEFEGKVEAEVPPAVKPRGNPKPRAKAVKKKTPAKKKRPAGTGS